MRTSYIRFSLIGAYCEEFLSKIKSCELKILDLRCIDGILYGNVKPSDYKKIARFTHKYKVRMRIHERHGVIFKALPYKKRIGIPIGIVMFFLIIYLFSNIVWDIKIDGNERISDLQILEVLKNCGIYAGANNDGFLTAEAEIKALLTLNELSWISVEKQGSRVYVKVSERLQTEKNDLPLSKPCNILAEKTGVIVSAEVYRGTLMYPIGSAVAEGDIVVSGTVNDGGGHIVYSHANAKIIAEFEDKAIFYQEYSTKETVKTGYTETKDYIQLFSFVFPAEQMPAKDNFIYKTENHIVSFFGIKMPWTIKKVIASETDDIEVERTTRDAERLLEQQLEDYCDNYLSDYEIVSIEKEYYGNTNGIQLRAYFTLRGDIAIQKEIYIN